MLTTFMKWIASAALLGSLLLPIFLGLRPPELFAVLRFLVAAGAAVVVFQAAAMGEYRWMFAFGRWRVCSTPSCQSDSPPPRQWS
jgi:hypothetical protein